MTVLGQNSFYVELREVDRLFQRRDKEGALQALTKVSLKLKGGEFVFLTGPSGSGKTTLLRLVLGMDRPTSGDVLTLGQPVHKMSEAQRRELRRNIGIVFQDHRLLKSLNVFENVELPLRFLGLSTKERQRRVAEILECVQMASHAMEDISVLSAGEKQRIGIARALVTCPSLIIADEPTGNLDPFAARSLIRMLRELRGHGTTVLIATHDMGLVRDFGGRVLELVKGNIPGPGSELNPLSKAYKIPEFWGAPTQP